MWSTFNPKDGSFLAQYPTLGRGTLPSRLSELVGAQFQWAETDVRARALLLKRCSREILAARPALARSIVDEMGKPITQALAEVTKSAACFSAYGSTLARELKPKGSIHLEPLGAILAVLPWNFPIWQATRVVAPALGLGNAVLIKPAPSTAGTALMFQRVLENAGVPRGILQTLLIEPELVGDLIADPRVVGVTVTGSERAGRAVAALAGQALKKTVLELGGSDAYIVLRDADLKHAASAVVQSRLVNSGQSCIACKRVIVERKVALRLQRLLVERLRGTRVGDPSDSKTEVGPLARADLRDQLKTQIAQSLEKGARQAFEPESVTEKGFFVSPQLLVGVKPGMPAFDEELFGPVLAMIEADDPEHAVDLANRSRFGLGGAVFTKNKKLQAWVARELQCGVVGINRGVVSDPRLPFGGVKASGHGRELGRWGLTEFANVKVLLG